MFPLTPFFNTHRRLHSLTASQVQGGGFECNGDVTPVMDEQPPDSLQAGVPIWEFHVLSLAQSPLLLHVKGGK